MSNYQKLLKNPIYTGLMRYNGEIFDGNLILGGGGEIRTHGPVAQTPVFKTGALDHSATPPII